jgi:glycosyltransferase involved in cell wall biosynthesis
VVGIPKRTDNDVASGRRESAAAGSTTIFVICFNYGKFLRRAVESALRQDDTNTRVAVVDDGSTDETSEVASSFGEQIVYFRKPNGGLSDARNYAAERCDTEYLAYLDADDWLPDDYVARCRSRLQALPGVAFAFTQQHYFGESDGSSTFPRFDPNRLKRGNCIPSCCLLRSEVVRQFPYDVRLRNGLEDWDFYLTLVENGLVGELVTDTYLWYRWHSSSMGHAVQANRLRRQQTYLRILWKHRRFIGITSAMQMIERSIRYRARRVFTQDADDS